MLTILVVDDEAVLVEALAYNLMHAGYRVLTAEDGEKALELLHREPVDLVLLDLVLPGMDGLEVCRRLRQDQATTMIPIIMLTARDNEIDKVVGLEVGADDYVTKPFGRHELLSRVRALLRRAAYPASGPTSQTTPEQPPATPQELIAGPLHIDLAGHRVTCRGQKVELQPRLFDLLVYLVRHRGIVLTRAQLLNQVWGYEYSGDTRTIDVHMRWLREKLEEDPNSPKFFHTVRGVGYVFRW